MKKWLQIFGFGFLTWLTPFVTSFFFFRGNQLVIDLATFKIIMALLLCLVTILCLKVVLKRDAPRRFAGAVGLSWLVINLVLDTLILLPLSGQSFPQYLSTTGLIYLLIPMLSFAMSRAATQRQASLES
jgi:hypothetical protein